MQTVRDGAFMDFIAKTMRQHENARCSSYAESSVASSSFPCFPNPTLVGLIDLAKKANLNGIFIRTIRSVAFVPNSHNFIIASKHHDFNMDCDIEEPHVVVRESEGG